MEKKTCIAMVPSPGLSHWIPQVEFARQLVQHYHDLHVTFLIPTLEPLTPSMLSLLKTLPPNIKYTVLHITEGLPQNINPEAKMELTVKHSIPYLHDAVTSLTSQFHLVALVFDIFLTEVHNVAKKFNLLSYLFFMPGAVVLSFTLFNLPNLDRNASSEFLSDSIETVNVPGCGLPFHVKELPEPVLFERSSEAYKSIIKMCQKSSLVDGIIVNTFTDLEAGAIRALQERRELGPCVYPVGPLIRTESNSEVNKLVCLKWLENQLPNSVLYVSFGSVGTLSPEQLNELAFGLELSGHKFLWAVRVPNKFGSSSYFGAQKKGDPLEYFPSGFLDRTKTQGLVVPSWAPQIEILGHESTGGFLSHCGWSSTLESVVNGVPMIAWPLFAEQKMNAKIITDAIGIGVRVNGGDGETGIVKREEIAKGVKRIMEGDESWEMRRRIKELSDGAAAAVSEHGSSRSALSSLAAKWKSF